MHAREQRLQTLALQRSDLLLRAAQQRAALAGHWHGLQANTQTLETGWQLWQALRQRPWLWLVPATAVTLMRRRGWRRALMVVTWLLRLGAVAARR